MNRKEGENAVAPLNSAIKLRLGQYRIPKEGKEAVAKKSNPRALNVAGQGLNSPFCLLSF